MPQPTPAGSDHGRASFGFPAIGRKKITAAFDGGRITSDGGVLLLAEAERLMGLARRIAACIADPRDPCRVIHGLDDILRARMLAIACGYEDANDLDALRDDPGFRLALGKLPSGATGLASQPTMSRWENAPTTREIARIMGVMVDFYCDSYPAEPAAVTLDIDDTCDVVHGYQQLSFWNGHHGERCFLPIHVVACPREGGGHRYGPAGGYAAAKRQDALGGGGGRPYPASGPPHPPPLADNPHHAAW